MTRRVAADVDGGWAWVVLVGSFFIFFIIGGLVYTGGIFYVAMLDHFQHSRSYTAWMGSLMNAFFMLGGPISSKLVEAFGLRFCLMFGGIIMSASYFVTAFAKSLETILLFYGVGVATGMCFSYSAVIIALNEYFHKKNAMATSVTMTGVGIGIFTLSQLLESATANHGWQTTFLYCSGLSLQICVFSAAFYPPKLIQKNCVKYPDEYSEKVRSEDQSYLGSTDVADKYFLGATPSKSQLNRSTSSMNVSPSAAYITLCHLQNQRTRISRDDLLKGLNYPKLTTNPHSFCSPRNYVSKNKIIKVGNLSYNNLNITKSEHIIVKNDHKKQADLGNLPLNNEKDEKLKVLDGCQYVRGEPSLGDIPKKANMFIGDETDEDLVAGTETHDNTIDEDIFMDLYSEMRSDSNLCYVDLFLLCVPVCLMQMAALTFFLVYKDFFNFLGAKDYCTIGLSVIGGGDIVGRLLAGILCSVERVSDTLLYSIVMLVLALVISSHLLFVHPYLLLLLSFLFGMLYAMTNVLLALVPTRVFGREYLRDVLGYELFMGGIGALIGAPIAGYLVDLTSSYRLVLVYTASCVAVASFLTLLLYIKRRKSLTEEGKKTEVVKESVNGNTDSKLV